MKKINPDNQIKELIKELSQNNFIVDNSFAPKDRSFIKQIYFPFYKNFVPFSTIDFEYPLTVLVGKNGSGKSSILHALYGCPKNNNPSKYWFSTKTDPIEDGDGKNNRHCFVYTYSRNEELYQVSYHRASRPGTRTKAPNPDYWETSGYEKQYKMTRELSEKYNSEKGKISRVPPIDADLIYIDFRGQLSAYDKYLYFGDLKKTKYKRKQDYIRRKSSELNKVLLGKKEIIKTGNGTKQNEKVVELTKEELHYISLILGETYTNGRIIKHNFFQNWGISAYLTKSNLSYTEAHAGSGEFAVVNLVHRLISIMNRNRSNIILLDEPENSLYPGAQKRLLEFLLFIIKRFKCQIVISTHSEKFISKLPTTAIKAIQYNDSTGLSSIKNHCRADTVFSELELATKKINICTEDKASCLLLNSVAKNEGFNNLNIYNLQCGAEDLEKIHIFSSSQQKTEDTFYILDGDKSVKKCNLTSLPTNKKEAAKYINSAILKINNNIVFPSSKDRNGNNKGDFDIIKYQSQVKYLEFFNDYVYFFPRNNPEEIIWNPTFIENYVRMFNFEVPKLNTKKAIYYSIVTQQQNGKPNKDEYYAFIKTLISQWIKNEKDSFDYVSIKKTLMKIQSIYDRGH